MVREAMSESSLESSASVRRRKRVQSVDQQFASIVCPASMQFSIAFYSNAD